MFNALRIAIAAVSLVFLLAGAAVVVAGGPARLAGVWPMVMGAAGLLAVAFERTRYRSEAMDRGWDAAAPSGADDGPIDPRFRATDERFIDPTTRRRVRVWTDPATGERRYRPDE